MKRLCSMLMIPLLTFVSCKIVTDNGGDNNLTYASYRIGPSEISGWTEATDGGWKTFTKSTMNDLVDGEYTFYCDGGMVEGAQQIISNASNEVLKTWILDFSSKTTASQMFQKIKTEKITVPKTITGFDESVALIDDIGLYGCTTYAVFGQFIFCLSFSGYTDKNKSFTDAAQILKVYQRR